jgi:hypothetical protein
MSSSRVSTEGDPRVQVVAATIVERQGGFKVKATVSPEGTTFTVWRAPGVLSGQDGQLLFFVRVGTLSGDGGDSDYIHGFPMYEDGKNCCIPDAFVLWDIQAHTVRFTVPRVAPWSITLWRFIPQDGDSGGFYVTYTFAGGEANSPIADLVVKTTRMTAP